MIDGDKLFYSISGFILALIVFCFINKNILVVDVPVSDSGIKFDNNCMSCKALEN